MPLLQLPPETLFQIFDYVGSSYFRSDLSRLTVSKQWSKFAHTECFLDFYVTQKTLRRLISSPYVELSASLVKDSMKTLDLDLEGFQDWDSIPPSQHDSQAANVTAWNGAHGRAVRAAWTTELNNDLLYLSTIVKQSQKLRILRIQATSELHPQLLTRRDYLFLSTLRDFLSVSNITCLELDLCGTRLRPLQNQDHGEEIHICRSIAALLTKLRRLRLRMRTICADVLKPRQDSTELCLNEVLINLGLSNESPLITSTMHATCCGSSPGGILQLKADMEEQAQVLVAQMEAPKIVRILTHAPPHIEMRAFDALTGRNVKLSEGAEWDDDGEVIEDEVLEESSSEISDLSSDDNA